VVKTRLQLEARHKENNLPKPSTSIAGSVPRAPAPALGGTTNTVASKFLPAIKMTRDILQKEGVRGMYKGMSASYLGVSEGVIQ
jgi:solute carrier family 25 protein 33/36